MKVTRGTVRPDARPVAWTSDTQPATPREAASGRAPMCLLDYLRLVIAALQAEHGLSENQAVEQTLDLAIVLCISDAQWQGYTPEATACSVIRSHTHSPHRLS